VSVLHFTDVYCYIRSKANYVKCCVILFLLAVRYDMILFAAVFINSMACDIIRFTAFRLG
jgi:hypothetical protein